MVRDPVEVAAAYVTVGGDSFSSTGRPAAAVPLRAYQDEGHGPSEKPVRRARKSLKKEADVVERPDGAPPRRLTH